MTDSSRLNITEPMLARLAAFGAQPKFGKTPGQVWNGTSMVGVRIPGEPLVNELVGRLQLKLQTDPRKTVVLAEFAATLKAFPDADTEDREEMLGYLEAIMDIIGIESSDGLLMAWLYGEDLAAKLSTGKP